VTIARVLDGAAIVVGGLFIALLATGGFKVATLTLTRPEDVLVVLVVILAVRLVSRPCALAPAEPRRAVAAGVLVYVLLMSFIVVTRHAALRTHALDLGYYVQLIWRVANGHGAYVTLPPMHA